MTECFAVFFEHLLFLVHGVFVVVLGVILDTFVFRSTLVPAILSTGASWNWWPAEMPDVEDVDTSSIGSLDIVDDDADCSEGETTGRKF